MERLTGIGGGNALIARKAGSISSRANSARLQQPNAAVDAANVSGIVAHFGAEPGGRCASAFH